MRNRMSNEEYDGPVIKFYISMAYDARTHVAYVKAPSNWADMSESERAERINQAAEEWSAEQVEIGAEAYESVSDATENGGGWGYGFSTDQLEDYFD